MNIPLPEAILLLVFCAIAAGAAWYSLREEKQ